MIVVIVIALVVVGVKVNRVLYKSECELWLYCELLTIIVKIFGDIVDIDLWLTGE